MRRPLPAPIARRALLAAAALAASRPARAAGSESLFPRIQALLDRYVEQRKAAFMTACVAPARLEPRFLSAGTLALDGTVPAGPDTICRIFSMTKPVTAAAAMMLLESGQVSLDGPVCDHLPELARLRVAIDPAKGLESRPPARPVTLRHLLTHTAGLTYFFNPSDPIEAEYRRRGLMPGDIPRAMPGDGPRPASLAEFTQGLAEVPLASDPGTRFRYSVALDVVGALIERVSGQPFADFLATRIFDPLGMADTGFQLPPSKLDRLATNYRVTQSGLVPIDAPSAAAPTRPPAIPAGGAGLLSTARDYARFQRMLLNRGTLDGAAVLKPESVALMTSDLLPPDVASVDGHGYGAGGLVRSVDGKAGRTTVYAWGGAAGTHMAVDVEAGVALNLMTQFMPADAYPLSDEFYAAARLDLDG